MMPDLWSTGCVHIGDECPTGDFPTIPAAVTGNRLYVLGGSVGGTGTEAAPFGTILEALDAAAAGDVIVVGEGLYTDYLDVQKALTIWGACVERVKIADTSPSSTGAFEVGASLVLKNMEITSTGMGISQQVLDSGAGLEGSGLFIHHARRRGFFNYQGTATLRDSLVFNMDMNTAGLRTASARGIQAWAEGGTAAITLENVIVEKASKGVVIGPASTGTATDVLVRNTVGGEDGQQGPCFTVQSGGTLSGSRLHAELCQDIGMMVETGSVDLEYVAIDHTRPSTTGTFGWGLQLKPNSTVTLRFGLFRNNTNLGITVGGPDAQATLADLVVLA
jgi:hypothetical protein